MSSGLFGTRMLSAQKARLAAEKAMAEAEVYIRQACSARSAHERGPALILARSLELDARKWLAEYVNALSSAYHVASYATLLELTSHATE